VDPGGHCNSVHISTVATLQSSCLGNVETLWACSLNRTIYLWIFVWNVRRPGRRRPEPRTLLCRNAQGTPFHQVQGPASPYAIEAAPGLPSYENYLKSPKAFQQILPVCSRSLNTWRPPWSPVVDWCPNLGWYSVWCDHSVLGGNRGVLNVLVLRASSKILSR
jgi:hypothetical protein